MNKSQEYFDKFPEAPVEIFHHNPHILQLAEEYIAKLKAWLEQFDVDIQHYGSGALEIAGKRELEFALYLNREENWDKVLGILERELGTPITKKEDRVRFGDTYKGFPVEIDLKKGLAAVEARETMRLLSLPGVRQEYEVLKLKYSYSEREYRYQKKKFFSELLEKKNEI